MNDRRRFAAFGGGLVVLFGAALGLGALLGTPAEPASATTAPDRPTGLQDTLSGYTLTDLTTPAGPNQQGALRFRITGPQGTVSRYNSLHEQEASTAASMPDAPARHGGGH